MVNQKKAFTLIELLIVVAIIGILAMIILPNFLAAQVKAKVARSQADINAIVTSLRTYRLDNNAIPPLPSKSGTSTILSPIHVSVLKYLTTPIAYMSVASAKSPFSAYHGYWYYNWGWFAENSGEIPHWYYNSLDRREKSLWMIHTVGPLMTANPYEVVDNNVILWLDYNPTNGISSRGVIQQHGD